MADEDYFANHSNPTDPYLFVSLDEVQEVPLEPAVLPDYQQVVPRSHLAELFQLLP